MKYRDIVYMALDELKLHSGDADFTEEHLLFLADKYRAYVLEKKYKDTKDEVSSENYQELCFDLEETPAISGTNCAGVYLKSTIKIPSMLSIGVQQAYPVNFLGSMMMCFIPLSRMPYVGEDKWLKNIIYVTQGPDDYLYLKSANPQYLHLNKFRVKAVFSDAHEAAKYDCNCGCENQNCDPLDFDFPLEQACVPAVLGYMMQELSAARFLPKDNINNAADDMSGAAQASPHNINRIKNDE